LELQQQNQDYLLAKLKYGLTSTFEVTTTQQDLDKARLTLIQSKIGYLNAVTQLYAHMGVLLEKWEIQIKNTRRS